jgi:hypothetical protein
VILTAVNITPVVWRTFPRRKSKKITSRRKGDELTLLSFFEP